MLTSIIAISILVLTAIVIREWDKRSRSTSSPSLPRQLIPSDEHERAHLQEWQLYQAAEICEQRRGSRWLGDTITVYYDDSMLSNSREISSTIKYLKKHGESNGIHLERR